MKGNSLSEQTRLEKPWGYEVIWADSSADPGYIGKLIYVRSGHRLSKQYHEKKEETIFIKSGNLTLETFGDIRDGKFMQKKKVLLMSPGDFFHIPPFLAHRFVAEAEDVEIIEVSTKQLWDVVRIEDDYGR